MHKLREFNIHVVTYEYDNATVRDAHMKEMKWNHYDPVDFKDDTLTIKYMKMSE